MHKQGNTYKTNLIDIVLQNLIESIQQQQEKLFPLIHS